jgi:hypothetical protein
MADEYLDKIPSIGISLQVALHGNRQLVLQSFVERDCTPAALNAILDKLRDAGERQFAWGEVENIHMKIKQEHINASQHQIKIEKTDEAIKAEWENGNRRGEPRLTQQQIQRQREAYEIAEGIKTRIAILTDDLVKWEAKLADGGVGSLSTRADAAG